MAGRRDRGVRGNAADRSLGGTPGDDELRPENLSDDERAWLVENLVRAANRAFPDGELIGKTAQQDFYFRRLLDVLIENASRYGTPVVGGSYVEVWQFTRDREPEWRTKDKSKRGRSGYARQSIRALVHEWNAAFDRRVREATGNGTIEFILDVPDADSSDVVLRAVITGLNLHGGTLHYRRTKPTSATRLPSERVVGMEDDGEERKRLIKKAERHVRRVEKEYLAKLSNAPLELLKQEIEGLERARRNYRMLAAAVLVVVGTAVAAYKIIFTKQPIPIEVELVNDCGGCLKSAWSDGKGHVALLSSSGKQVTEWADLIADPKGAWVRSVPGTGSVMVGVPDGAPVVYNFHVPQKWHEQPKVVLPAEFYCTEGSTSQRSIVCAVLIDFRSISPTTTMRTAALGITFGDKPDVIKARESQIDPDGTRAVIVASHDYALEAKGVFDLSVCESSDPAFMAVTETSAPGKTVARCGRLTSVKFDGEVPARDRRPSRGGQIVLKIVDDLRYRIPPNQLIR